jgi:hypothetical protein
MYESTPAPNALGRRVFTKDALGRSGQDDDAVAAKGERRGEGLPEKSASPREHDGPPAAFGELGC